MARDSNMRKADTKRIKPISWVLPACIFLLFFLSVFYFARHHTAEDQRIITNNELRKEFPEAELIAPTLPPKYWDETSKSWQSPKGQFVEQRERTRLQSELEELRKQLKELQRGNKALKNKR